MSISLLAAATLLELKGHGPAAFCMYIVMLISMCKDWLADDA